MINPPHQKNSFFRIICKIASEILNFLLNQVFCQDQESSYMFTTRFVSTKFDQPGKPATFCIEGTGGPPSYSISTADFTHHCCHSNWVLLCTRRVKAKWFLGCLELKLFSEYSYFQSYKLPVLTDVNSSRAVQHSQDSENSYFEQINWEWFTFLISTSTIGSQYRIIFPTHFLDN